MPQSKKSISPSTSEKMFGTKFISGGDKPMERMLKQSKKLNHKLNCCLWHNTGKYTSYWFGSYKTIQDYETAFKDEQQYSTFEIIPPNTPVKIFFDVEWIWDWCKDESVIWNRVIEAYNYALDKCGLTAVDVDDFTIATASDLVKKGSLHLYNIHHHISSIEQHGTIVDTMYEYMVENAYEYFFLNNDGIIRCIVDGTVYNGNQQMRLYKAHKLIDGEFVRPFKGIDDSDVVLEDTIITYHKDVSDDITVNTDKLKKSGMRLRKQQPYPDEVVENWCDGLDDEKKKNIMKQLCCNNIKIVKYEPTNGIDMYEALSNILPRLSDDRAHETNDWRNVIKACAYYCDYNEGITLALRFAKRDDYWTKHDGQQSTVKRYDHFSKSEVKSKYEPIGLILKMLREDVGNTEYYQIKRKYLINEQKYIETMLIGGNDLDIGTLYHKYHKDCIKWCITGSIFHFNENCKLWVETQVKDGLGEIREELQRFVSSRCIEIGMDYMNKNNRLNEIIKNREQYPNEPSDDEITEKIKVIEESIKKIRKVCSDIKSLGKGVSCLKSVLHLYKDNDFEQLLDREPDELPIKGHRVIRLDTRQVRPRCKKDLWTYELNVEYIKSDYKNITKFVNNITLNNQVYTEYMRMLTGYSFTGRIDDRKFYIAHGNGSNGKSSYFGLVNAILGSGYCNASEDAFAVKKDSKGAGRATPEIIPLLKARTAVYNEPDEECVLNQGRLKSITGGDKLSGRELFKKQIEFNVFCKPFILCNPLPKCNMDKAMKDRIRLLPFKANFDLEDEQLRLFVAEMKTKYLDEAFSWFLDGAVKWYETKRFDVPQVCIDDMGLYIKNNDTIESFINDECEQSKLYNSPPQFLYDKYKDYCLDNCKIPVSTVIFGYNFSERYSKERITKDGKRFWAYIGIRYKTDVVSQPLEVYEN